MLGLLVTPLLGQQVASHVTLVSICDVTWGRFWPGVEQVWSSRGAGGRRGIVLGRSSLDAFLESLPGALGKGNPIDNPSIWGARLEGFQELKSNTLKSQILVVICCKIV